MRQAAGTYSKILSGAISKSGPHSLPLARIKKIMKKSSDDVKMISGEAPIIFSVACDLFIQDVTRRSWNMTAQDKRRTLQKYDVASAIVGTDLFDFLANVATDGRDHSVGESRVEDEEDTDHSPCAEE